MPLLYHWYTSTLSERYSFETFVSSFTRYMQWFIFVKKDTNKVEIRAYLLEFFVSLCAEIEKRIFSVHAGQYFSRYKT